jgi:EAL domain-containing protein (putative c-di-GMP-specific phosphodiesterase class I)
MIESEENFEIVRTIIKLGQNLKMKVIAEGIETNQQLAQLKRLNCEYGQGYIFAKPMATQAAETFIAKSLKKSTYSANQLVINAEVNM